MYSLGFTTTSENLEPGTPVDGAETDIIKEGEDSLELPEGPVQLVSELATARQEKQAAKKKVEQLENEIIELRNRGDTDIRYCQQVHVLAINAARQERDTLEQRIAALLRENEHYRQRTESLEAQILEQNHALKRAQSQALNYDAVLSQLAKAEAENKAVTEQRDAIYRELQEERQQSERVVQEKEALTNRLTDLGKHSVLLKQHWEEQVLEEQRKSRFWQHKYECEFNERCHGNENETTANQHQINEDRHSPLDLKLYNPQSLNDDQEATAVRDDNSVLSDPARSHAATSGDMTSPRTRKKRFEVGRSSLPQCKNCGTVFDTMKSTSSPCRFHIYQPQPYKSWRMVGDDFSDLPPERKPRFYWPCCNKAGIQEPPGCRMLRNHDIMFPLDSEE